MDASKPQIKHLNVSISGHLHRKEMEETKKTNGNNENKNEQNRTASSRHKE